jgi:hypothetical protein
VLALALLWVPITAHCKLELIPGLEFLHCAGDTSTKSDCEGDSCQTVESGAYKTQDNDDLVSLPVLIDLSALVPPAEPFDLGPGSVSVFTISPPELPRCWQFLLRTAPAVRAPSVAS